MSLLELPTSLVIKTSIPSDVVQCKACNLNTPSVLEQAFTRHTLPMCPPHLLFPNANTQLDIWPSMLKRSATSIYEVVLAAKRHPSTILHLSLPRCSTSECLITLGLFFVALSTLKLEEDDWVRLPR